MAGPDINYDDLQSRLTDPSTETRGVGAPLHGRAASAAGREFLLSEYGSDEAIARALRPGRPRVGESARGESPTVRGRISDADFAAFKRLEAETGKKQSELVREAVQLLLAEHKIGA